MLIVGLDTGERAGKTFAVWEDNSSPAWDKTCQTNMRSYTHPLDAVQDAQFRNRSGGVRFVLENMVCSFNLADHEQFVALAASGDIDLYFVRGRDTKNRSKDHGISYAAKDDRLDAWVLLQIGKEGTIARIAPRLRTYSVKPEVRLRQVGYAPTHPAMIEMYPHLPAITEEIKSLPVPDFAVLMGAARQLKNSRRWNDDRYQFFTAIVRAFTVVSAGSPSWRKMKASGRLRSLARSNYMHHGLKNKTYEERKAIMRAQDAFDRFVLNLLVARRATFAE